MPPLLEVLLVLVFLELRIWIWEGLGALTWLATLAPILFVAVSWLARGDSWRSLGLLLAATPMKEKMFMFFAFLIFWRIIGLVGEIWNPGFLSQEKFLWKFLTHIVLYFPWSLFQQLCLNGYFLNRLTLAFKNEKAAIFLSGFAFSVIHFPNPVLLIATFFGGLLSAYFFQRNKNLYLLAFLHAILAVSLKYFLPDAWHHNLKIGPGFWE